MGDHDAGWVAEERVLFLLLKQVLLHQNACDVEAEIGLAPDDLSLDWERFIDYAVDGGVAPLVYVRLQEDHYDIPVQVMDRLRGFYMLTAAENMENLKYARQIFDLCNNQGISIIPLRGIHFADTLYPDPALRPLSDIDLLVRPEQMDHLAAGLASLGYWRVPGHLHQWTNERVIVDAHTDLMGGDRIAARRRAVEINMAEVWACSTSSGVYEGCVRRLAWEDEVLTCGLHAIKHSCDRILWFVDIALMTGNRDPADWHRLTERARAFKLQKPAYYAFSYLERTIGVSIPGPVLEAWHPNRAGWLERRCMAQVMAGRKPGRFGEFFTLFMMERLTDKWAFVKETCFPQRDLLEQAYGPTGTGGVFTRLKRIGHVTGMAFDVVKQGIQRKRS